MAIKIEAANRLQVTAGFENWSPEKQKQYLKDHPNSKFGSGGKAKPGAPAAKPATQSPHDLQHKKSQQAYKKLSGALPEAAMSKAGSEVLTKKLLETPSLSKEQKRLIQDVAAGTSPSDELYRVMRELTDKGRADYTKTQAYKDAVAADAAGEGSRVAQYSTPEDTEVAYYAQMVEALYNKMRAEAEAKKTPAQKALEKKRKKDEEREDRRRDEGSIDRSRGPGSGTRD